MKSVICNTFFTILCKTNVYEEPVCLVKALKMFTFSLQNCFLYSVWFRTDINLTHHVSFSQTFLVFQFAWRHILWTQCIHSKNHWYWIHLNRNYLHVWLHFKVFSFHNDIYSNTDFLFASYTTYVCRWLFGTRVNFCGKTSCHNSSAKWHCCKRRSVSSLLFSSFSILDEKFFFWGSF